jgi:Pyruvate/2-oxoacid:ferredoxin oxidoreductase gamma subunit
MIKIIVHGEGGQGVKLLGETLASILLQLGKEVALTYEYDANVRSGSVTAYLTYDDHAITNPIIEEADYLIILTKNADLKGRMNIVEDCACETKNCEICKKHAGHNIRVPLNVLAETKTGSKKFVNMVTLGYLLKVLEIDIKHIDLKKVLPDRFVEENLKAIDVGYCYES